MWSRMFIRSSIVQKNAMCVVLTMTYSYYGLYHYDEVHVLESIEEARNMFCRLRSNDQLRIETVSDRTALLVETPAEIVAEKKDDGGGPPPTPPAKTYAEVAGSGGLKVVKRE